MEIKTSKVIASGRLTRDPAQVGENVHFLLDTGDAQPLHGFCAGETAKNLLRFCKGGDELCLEGELRHVQFTKGAQLLVVARYISYGRKERSLRPEQYLG